MEETAETLLVAALSCLVFAFVWGRYFFREHTVVVQKPVFTPPPGAATISPTFKRTLKLRVPKRVRIDESEIVEAEYFQGVTYFPFELANTFLYDRLNIIPRALPNNLRGLFSGTFLSSSEEEFSSALEHDLHVRAMGSNLAVAPEGWVKKPAGQETPCKWKWSVTGQKLGRFDLVMEFSDPFKTYFPDRFLETPQAHMQIEVRNAYGLSLKQIHAVKSIAVALGWLLGILAAVILALPKVVELAAEMLKPILG